MGLLNNFDLNLTLNDLYQNNTLSLNKNFFGIPHIGTNKINSIIIPSGNLHDRVYWGEGGTNGSFSTKSSYKLINESRGDQKHNNKNFDWIWTLYCPNKIKKFYGYATMTEFRAETTYNTYA